MNYEDMTPEQKIIALGANDNCFCDHKRNDHYFERDGFDTNCKVNGCGCTSFNWKESWKDFAKSGLWCLGIICGLALLVIFVIEPLIAPYANEWQKDYDERMDWKYETWATVDVSKNCDELQTALLGLSAKGANADSWFPDSYDRMMKTGKERYEILKC